MREKIIQCAEMVCKALGEVGDINILRLAEFLGERSLIAYQAIGWLAREGKIRYRQEGNQIFISLMEGESHE